jgi:short subunit dehydrogenase-like uncharacterized protein
VSNATWMIYGAYGYTGALVAEEALKRGHRPLLAGRSRQKLEPLSQRLGLEYVVIDLADERALRNALEPLELVFHAAGPFVDTSEAMIRACLATRTNYIDVTGEVAVFRNTFAHHTQAAERKILLLSGAGFDVVPTDCLANHLAAQIDAPTHLEIAVAGMDSVSAGTLKSMFDGGLQGGLVRRDGQLKPHPVGKGARTQRFLDRERSVVPIPWGDLETAYRSTGIPNITTYMAFPRKLAALTSATWPLTAATTPLLRGVLGHPSIKRRIQDAIGARVAGPDEHTRRSGHAQIWASVQNAAGARRQAWLETMEAYAFTAAAGVRIVEKTLAQRPVGALTPAQAFGKDLVMEIEGTRRVEG